MTRETRYPATSEDVDFGRITGLGTGRIVEVEVVITRLDGTIDRYFVSTESPAESPE